MNEKARKRDMQENCLKQNNGGIALTHHYGDILQICQL